MRYLDSNVFIYPVVADERREEKASRAQRILTRVASGKLEAATSALTWDELVWSLTRLLGRASALKKGRMLLEFPNLSLLSVDESVISRAQVLLDDYELKPRDSIHAACALENGIREIVSDDPDFDKVRELRRIRLEAA